MRARIIFQGLTLFKFGEPTKGAKPGDNLGTLEAWLVSDPRHAMMPLHHHVPMMGYIGRDLGKPIGQGRVRPKTPLATAPHISKKELTIELRNPGVPSGVFVDGSFLDYVPRLGALYGREWEGNLDEKFITRKIIITSGTIRTREFVTWDWHGSTPAKLGYMDSNFQGFGANEVIVDIGNDDADVDTDAPDRLLRIYGEDMDEKLLPYTKGHGDRGEVDPNTVEVLIDNLPARRRRPVFWGLHFQMLFQAAAFTRRTAYSNVDQYNNFLAAANDYDPYEWADDQSAMGIGFPFPYLIDPERNKLDGLAEAVRLDKIVSPPSPECVRQKGEGIPKGSGGGSTTMSHGTGGMSAAGGMMSDTGGMMASGPGSPGCDPANSNICLPAIIG